MNDQGLNQIQKRALDNYSSSEPWPDNDNWHFYTNKILNRKVNELLMEYCTDEKIILNAGCGKTTYNTSAKIIYMDIVKEYIENFSDYIVGSVENVPLEDSSIDVIICVGSVLNYVDIQKALSEFSRVLKDNGLLILEFERSNSAEFLFTAKYKKTIFQQEYCYNNQKHFLWMYDENFVEKLCDYYNLNCLYKYRFHVFSSLLYRLGIKEKRAAKYCLFDNLLQPISYPFSHNTIMILRKVIPS